jgi:hypothetical protein
MNAPETPCSFTIFFLPEIKKLKSLCQERYSAWYMYWTFVRQFFVWNSSIESKDNILLSSYMSRLVFSRQVGRVVRWSSDIIVVLPRCK